MEDSEPVTGEGLPHTCNGASHVPLAASIDGLIAPEGSPLASASCLPVALDGTVTAVDVSLPMGDPDASTTGEPSMAPSPHPIGELSTAPSDNSPLRLGKATSLYLTRAEEHPGQIRRAAHKAFVNGALVKIVLDSGADASFITTHLVDVTGLVVETVAPVTITMADQSTITTRSRVRARLRVPTSSGTKAKYHRTTVTAYVLPPPATGIEVPSGVDVFLGTDWLYANKAVLDYSTIPFTVSYDAGASPDTWVEPMMTGLDVLSYATDALYAASTVPLLTERQCKRMLRQKSTAANAFVAMVCPASASPLSIADGQGRIPIGTPVETDSGSSAGPYSSPGMEHLGSPGDSMGRTQASATTLPDVGDGPVSHVDMTSLLLKYKHIFDEPTSLPPDRHLEGPVIPLATDATPQFVRGKRLSPGELAEVTKQVKDLLAKGYIQPSSSPWGAPVLFVPKSDGTLRMAIDYRKLNALTTPNRWPLPHIDELLDQVREASVFSLLDLRSGYHQIRLAQEDIPKTAFITPVGLYEFRVLPFGLCNAPAIFCRYMSRVLGPLLGKSVVVYLDDILVFSKTPAEHLLHLEQVFSLLEANQLFAKGSKCTLNRTELKYLGHIIGHGTLKVDPIKIAAISKWPLPKFPKELQSFLGLANYFCRFMQGYSSLAAPLTSLVASTAPKTKRAKGEAFTADQWTPEHDAAFEQIKHCLCTAPVLVLPDPNQAYRLIADASTLGTGAVLEQHGHPVAYLSHKFNPTEARYHIGEKELLAVILALKAWRCYLHGCPGGLTLVTDHHPLTYLNTQPHLSPKQVRWSQFLSQFMPFKWEYIPGRTNVADPLSRHPTFDAITVTHLLPRNTPSQQLTARIQRAYASDPWFSNPLNIQSLQFNPDGFWRGGGSGASTSFSAKHPNAEQIVIPDDSRLKQDLLHEFHDSPSAGHPGVERTLDLIARFYWWPGMLLDVHQYVLTCTACQLNKSTQRRIPPIMPLSIPIRRWDSVSLDFIINLPRCRRFDSILVVVDRLSKYAVFIPTTTHVTAQKCAELFVTRVASRFGLPSELVSDRDSKFTGAFWPTVFSLFGTKLAMSTPYHPQTDGQTERMNRLLEDTLRHYVNEHQSNWVSLLPMAEFAINNAYQSSIQSSPFFLNFGQHPRVPGVPLDTSPPITRSDPRSFTARIADAIQSAKSAMTKAHDRMRRLHTGTPTVYTVGQQVLLSTKNLAKHPGLSDKLSHKWEGPFTITRVITKWEHTVAVELQLPHDWKIHPTVSTSQVKPYHARPIPPISTVPLVQRFTRP